MENEYFEIIVDRIKKNKKKFLGIQEPLTEAQQFVFINELIQNSVINHLLLSDHALSKSILIALNKIMENKQIIKLDLHNNALNSNDFVYIAEIIHKNNSLSSLNLCGTQMVDQDLILLSQALQKNKTLTKLYLERNPKISDCGIKALLTCLRINQSITDVCINQCGPISLEMNNLIREHRIYNQHKKDGVKLLFPMPLQVKQKGNTCGFYAVQCASQYISTVFGTKPPLPARKKDVDPKSQDSLRRQRKMLGIQGMGEIFNAEDLAKICTLANCKSVTCEIDDCEQFKLVIQKAIDNNLPILIPYGNDKLNKPAAIHAHWATIIGYQFDEETKNSIFIASNQQYLLINASILFGKFFNIENDLSPVNFFKSKKGAEWEIFKEGESTQHLSFFKTYQLPKMSLDHFRRKLIIAMPPQFNIDDLELNKTNIRRTINF